MDGVLQTFRSTKQQIQNVKPKVNQVNYLSILERPTVIHGTLLNTKTDRAFHTYRCAYCCFHLILNLEVQVATAHPSQLQTFRICPQAISPGEITLTRIRQFHIDRCACSFSPKNSVRYFLAQILLYKLPCPPEPGFHRSIASDLFTFSRKKNSR